MNETFNKNVKVGKLTKMLGIAVCLIVIDPLMYNVGPSYNMCSNVIKLIIILGSLYIKCVTLDTWVKFQQHMCRINVF